MASPRAAARRKEAGDPDKTLRTCVITRVRYEPEDLVHLVAGPDGVIEVDRSGKLAGRGVWLLPQRKVVEQAEARPAQIARALKLDTCQTAGLRERIYQATLARVLDLLSLAARAGLVASGADQLEGALRAGEVLALVLACDASAQTTDKIQSIQPDVFCVTLPLTREALGARVGKGPRAALGFRPGSVTRAMLKQLPRLAELR